MNDIFAELERSGINRVSAISKATSNCLVFATDTNMLDCAIASSAGAILTKPSLAADRKDVRVLPHPDPRLAFSLAAKHLVSNAEPAIHSTAVIHPSAVIEPGTSIGPYAVVDANVRIGRACNLAARVTVHADTTLGDRCVIQTGAVLGATGFGYARDAATGQYTIFPQQGVLVIEDDVEIGANTTIDRGALEETRIGRGTKIDNLVHIGHNCRIGRNVIIAAQTGISGSSVVEDGAILGGQVGIGEHAWVGPGVILGGGAGVLSNKKLSGSGKVFWGRPAQPLKQYLRDLAKLRKE